MSNNSEQRAQAAKVIADFLADNEIEFEQPEPDTFAAILPGEHRQKTTVSMIVGEQSLSINVFVVRHADENLEAVYRWLLERNLRTYGVAYAIDHLGDVYLVGKVSLPAVTAQEMDRLLGSVLENSDGAFDALLELGFETAIRREWKWRLSRGESTANLAAFKHLADPS